MADYAVIVDGYHIPFGSSRGFASAFKDRGVVPINVLSTPEPVPQFQNRWFPDDWAQIHCFTGDFAALADIVAGYDPICIVPGQEMGVELCGRLNDTLMPERGNAPGSGIAQRHKGEMIKALAGAGLPHIRTLATDDADEAEAWIAANGLAGRQIILKPPKSGGTDNVHLTDDWRPYFEHILGATNDYGMINDVVVVQEFIQGPEYIVDLYSVDGRHGLVDVWVYGKHDRGPRIGIYDKTDLLRPDHPLVAALGDYTMRAATACGIRNGSTHAEVILTDSGPILIELAARYSGSCMMISGLLGTGDNQIERTVRHYVDGEFRPGYEVIDECRTLWLCADNAGRMTNIELVSAADLPTVRASSLPENGARVRKTNDVHTNLGWMIQVAGDWDAIEDDYQRIRDLEKQLVITP